VTRRGLLLALLLPLFAPARPAHAAGGVAPRELVVFAAASLRDVFAELAPAFEKQHAGVKVRFSVAGSQELRMQIEHGAKADVFASADQRQMTILQLSGLVRAPVIFARNQLVVVVSAANPARLSSFSDLPKALHIVVGAPEVPIGAYTDALLVAAEKALGKSFRADVVARIRSRELNVRQVLAKIALGEADAGIVYKTDALAAKHQVRAIAIPADINVAADGSIAALAAAPHPELAKAWVAAVLAKPGQDVLAAAGFMPVGSRKPSQEEK
jgi:molybdate transport system substrate-binding protein